MTWLAAPAADQVMLDRWCRAVGRPIVIQAAAATPLVPDIAELTIVTWNAHVGEGRLADLVSDLRAGALTDGRPVQHFVLLVQELFRRGSEVPHFDMTARGASAIGAETDAPDVRALAQTLRLAVVYVPSMRNGAARREDRGNAIFATLPLADPMALELPFERQRRVAVGATVHVRTGRGIEPLQVMNVHLDPLSAPSALWVFRNPRSRQLAAVFDAVPALAAESSTAAGAILGGDFNTVQGGASEAAYQRARMWSTSLAGEDPRRTHRMGRLDFLFFRLGPAWRATSHRATGRFGSDHYPVIGRVHETMGARD